jgi:hypothetical protein
LAFIQKLVQKIQVKTLETFARMIFCPYPALKSYSIGHLLPINSLIPCDFALSKNKISIRAKVSN